MLCRGYHEYVLRNCFSVPVGSGFLLQLWSEMIPLSNLRWRLSAILLSQISDLDALVAIA